MLLDEFLRYDFGIGLGYIAKRWNLTCLSRISRIRFMLFPHSGCSWLTRIIAFGNVDEFEFGWFFLVFFHVFFDHHFRAFGEFGRMVVDLYLKWLLVTLITFSTVHLSLFVMKVLSLHLVYSKSFINAFIINASILKSITCVVITEWFYFQWINWSIGLWPTLILYILVNILGVEHICW